LPGGACAPLAEPSEPAEIIGSSHVLEGASLGGLVLYWFERYGW
jgi:hypothetical protein